MRLLIFLFLIICVSSTAFAKPTSKPTTPPLIGLLKLLIKRIKRLERATGLRRKKSKKKAERSWYFSAGLINRNDDVRGYNDLMAFFEPKKVLFKSSPLGIRWISSFRIGTRLKGVYIDKDTEPIGLSMGILFEIKTGIRLLVGYMKPKEGGFAAFLDLNTRFDWSLDEPLPTSGLEMILGTKIQFSFAAVELGLSLYANLINVVQKKDGLILGFTIKLYFEV